MLRYAPFPAGDKIACWDDTEGVILVLDSQGLPLSKYDWATEVLLYGYVEHIREAIWLLSL